VSDKSASILVRVRLVDDPSVEVGEDVHIGVGVGAVEFQLYTTCVSYTFCGISCTVFALCECTYILVDCQ